MVNGKEERDDICKGEKGSQLVEGGTILHLLLGLVEEHHYI